MYFYLKEPKSQSETLIIIQYYVKSEHKNFKYSTGQKLNPDDWDLSNRMPKLKRGSDGKKIKHIISILDNYKDFLNDTIDQFEKEKTQITRNRLKSLFDKEFKFVDTKVDDAPEKLHEAIDLYIIAKNKSHGQSKSWNEKYNNLKNKIILFNLYTGKDLTFEMITDDWIDSYSGFLRELPKLLQDASYLKKVKILDIKLPTNPYNDNTLNRHINFLFTFLNWSHGKYHNIDLNKLKNPVSDFNPDDVHLTTAEVEMLESVQLPRESLERVRDLFLIGVYSGQRFSDYTVFEKADVNGNMIIKKAEKTESESYVPLHPKLLNLLEKYNWELPTISSQNFNPHIREVCRIAGILDEVKFTNYIGNKKTVEYIQKCDAVSSHTARRTFITLSSERGMPDHIIMKITGIRDPKTLQKYKKTSQQSVSDFANKIWGK